MNDYYSALLIALIVIVLLVALTIPAVMMSFKRKQDTSNSGTAPTTGAGDDKSKPAAKAAEPEKKKAKEKKLEVTWSWWLFLYSFLIAGFVIPSLMADSLSTRDTWLLVILVSVAATYAVATMVKYQFDFDDAVGKVNKIAVGLLILGFAFLLFQNNFSTTATLKDAGTRTSGFTSGIKEFLAGKRYGSGVSAPAATTTTTSTAIPAGVVPSVTVPSCNDGWSKVVSIPAYSNVTSAWNMDTVQAAWRENGEWKQFEGKYLSGSFDAVKYCAKNSSYAGEEMFLTWTPR